MRIRGVVSVVVSVALLSTLLASTALADGAAPPTAERLDQLNQYVTASDAHDAATSSAKHWRTGEYIGVGVALVCAATGLFPIALIAAGGVYWASQKANGYERTADAEKEQMDRIAAQLGALSDGDWRAVRILFDARYQGLDAEHREAIRIMITRGEFDAIDKYLEPIKGYNGWRYSTNDTANPGTGVGTEQTGSPR